MTKRSAILAICAVLLPVLVGASVDMHLDLVHSFPQADTVLTEAPAEIWLEFSAVPDMEQTSFSVRGPDGTVELGDIAKGASAETIRAEVADAMGDGEYTLSWVGAPMNDHPVRGRYTFTIAGTR